MDFGLNAICLAETEVPRSYAKSGIQQASKSNPFKVCALLRESDLLVQQTGAVLSCVLPIHAKPRLQTVCLLNNKDEDLFRM